MKEAIEKVHECSSDGRISRVAVYDEINVLGWRGGRSMYKEFKLITVRQVQDVVLDGHGYVSWHYFVLGQK